MNKMKPFIDLDALNLVLRGLSLNELNGVIENAELRASILAEKHQSSIYQIMRSSKSYNRVIIFPLTEHYRYGEKNSETPAMVLCIGRRTSVSTDILVQLKGFPLGKREYQIARYWLCNLCKGVKPLSQLTYLVSSFHIAVDFEVPISEFALERKRSKKVSLHFENGSLTGYYIGSPRSIKWFAIYSRASKLLKRKIIGTGVHDPIVTRCELREKLPGPTEWHNLRAVCEKSLNSNNIVLYDLERIANSRYYDDFTLNTIRQLGIHSIILAQTSDASRRKLRRQLSGFSVKGALSKGFDDGVPSLSNLKYLCSNRKRWVKTENSISRKQFASIFL